MAREEACQGRAKAPRAAAPTEPRRAFLAGDNAPVTNVDDGERRDPTDLSRRGAIRALVTRPREEAESLAAALAARGVDAVLEPMMEVHYRATAAPDLAGVQALLCTSANGARALARSTKERDLLLLAVGDATASRA